MISDGGKSFESNKKKNVLETGMGEWLEKTSLNKGNVSCFLNEKVEPAICASGAEVFQAEEPGSAKQSSCGGNKFDYVPERERRPVWLEFSNGFSV